MGGQRDDCAVVVIVAIIVASVFEYVNRRHANGNELRLRQTISSSQPRRRDEAQSVPSVEQRRPRELRTTSEAGKQAGGPTLSPMPLAVVRKAYKLDPRANSFFLGPSRQPALLAISSSALLTPDGTLIKRSTIFSAHPNLSVNSSVCPRIRTVLAFSDPSKRTLSRYPGSPIASL